MVARAAASPPLLPTVNTKYFQTPAIT